ncbi:peptide ABC transporter substrate-binding protein [Aeromicrobium phragmitis]|uniref:Peptide ABC transporter substrate-binding protein n=1 Tax=Aeromicrobium phragmitis TaxID=2478914 RepID=A0A3L8PK45_9ACTN|nr:ABC transporter substrate-binding protein [Aeromicrobium phragmitis]RLV55083.1 peptide ABC transporter substrate-binding protein [Aeromicrobium phragmitis]
MRTLSSGGARSALRLAAATTAAALVLTACSGGSGSEDNGGGTLRFGLDSDVPNLVTPQNQGSASMMLNSVLHRGLVAYDADGEVVPALAERWEEEGNQVFTFHLREGLTFHDGSDLTSDDVKATFEHLRDPEAVAKLFPVAEGIESIETPDELTAVVQLAEPDAAFLPYLADVSGAILPSESIGADDPTYVGAGPFSFVSYEQGSSFVVERFDEYYEPDEPAYDTIEFQILPDQSARDNALLSGSVDMISFVGWSSYDQVENAANLVLDETEGPFMYLQFNTTPESPFSDPRVRQAVAYAVDRQAVVDSALGGEGAPLWGMPMPESSDFYNDDQANYYEQDLDKARQLLAEAGYPDGFTARMLSSSQYDFHQNTALSVQGDLEKIGIELEMNLPDWPTRLQLGAEGAYDIAVYGTVGVTNDPAWLDQMLTPAGSQNAPFGYDDPTVNELLDRGRAAADEDERKAIYDELGEHVLEQAPIIGLAWRSQAYGYVDTIEGFSNIPGFLTFDSGYTLASAAPK